VGGFILRRKKMNEFKNKKMRPCDECGELDYLQAFKAKKGKKVYHLCRLCVWDYRLIDENVKVEIIDNRRSK
jgi:hypothetical protein